ncbi:MAG: peptidase [Rhodobiaceae bacterium]|nr:peptidase [Rhodobiaceae bacterium]
MTFRIPNWVSLALVALFVAVLPFAGLSWAMIGTHLAIGAALLLVGMGLFAMNVLGGGDAKLLAAIGLWMGWAALPVYLLSVAIIGGMLSFALVVFRMAPLTMTIVQHPWISRLHDKKAGVPYGIALAAGALVTLPQTLWFALAAVPA